MTTVERRTLLKGGLAVAALGGPFAGFVNAAAGAVVPKAAVTAGLVPVPDLPIHPVPQAPDGDWYIKP